MIIKLTDTINDRTTYIDPENFIIAKAIPGVDVDVSFYCVTDEVTPKMIFTMTAAEYVLFETFVQSAMASTAIRAAAPIIQGWK